MRRAVPMVLSLLVIAAACGNDPEPTPSLPEATSPSTATPTTVPEFLPDPFEAALAGRLEEDGSIPLDTAVDLFATAFGAFPGGDPGAFPDPGPHAATMALMAVAAHHDELTPDQVTALHAAVEGAQGEVATGGQVLADGVPGPLSVAYVPSVAQPATEAELVGLVEQARDEIARRLGHPLAIPVRVVVLAAEDAEFVAVASPMRDGDFIEEGTPHECLIQVRELPISDFTRSVVTHEVFHCFQYTAYDDLAATWSTAPWITEGQAFWAAAEIVGLDQDWITVGYRDWLCNPEVSLWKRHRPAMGIYATVASHGTEDVWRRLEGMLGLSREAALEALGMPPLDALRLSATGRMRDAARGGMWDFDGTGLPVESCRSSGTADPEHPWEWSGSMQQFASPPPFEVDVTGDVVRVKAAADAGAFQFSDGSALPWSGSLSAFACLRDGGCECPDGRSLGDVTAPPGPVAVGVGSRGGDAAASLTPMSLEDACLLPEELPRISLHGSIEIELAGGACVLDAGDLIVAVGYDPSHDARLQPEPWPTMRAIIFVRAQPGTWDTGSFYIEPSAGAGFANGTGGLNISIAPGLLAGTFTYLQGYGSYSCPRLLTPAEAAAGTP